MSKAPRYRRPLIEALEPRLLFSATADIAVFDDGNSDAQYLAQAAQDVDLVGIYMPDETHPLMLPDVHNDIAQIDSVIFVDTAVDDYQNLIEDIEANLNGDSVAIVYLDSYQDGIAQITATLSQYSNITAIHLISHSSAGTLQLGSSVITAESMARYDNELISWRNSLGADADILIYGCSLGADAKGLQLLDRIAELTQADIAASDDLTGHQSLGGDWELEVTRGTIEAPMLVSAVAQEQWNHLLADVVYETSGTTSDGIGIINTNDAYQSFADNDGTGTYKVNSLEVQLRRSPFAVDQTVQTITVSLVSGGFNGTVLGSNTMLSSSLSTSLAWERFSFSTVDLTYGQTYYIKVTASGSNPDPLVFAGIHNANNYNGGTYLNTNGVSDANRDLAFQVIGTNTAPTVANAIPNRSATEDSAFSYQFPTNTFNDADGDALTYSAQLSGGGALPSWLSFNAATRTFSGTPLNADVGTISVQVTASDNNGGTVSDTFDIAVANVNDAPTVNIPSASYNATEQVAINLHGTGITVADVDSSSLTVTIAGPAPHSHVTANAGTTGVAISSGNGTDSLVLTGTAAQLNDLFAGNNGGTLTYRLAGDTPAASVTLSITASDGSLTGNDTATINITAVNDTPVNTVPGAQSTNEDTALVFSAGNGNQIQITDVDAGSSTMQVTLSVTNGTLTLAGISGLSFTTGDGTADSSLVFTGTRTDINNALSTLTYNPTTNYNGAAVLSLTTSDLGNTGTGGTLTDTDNVNITVNPVNDAPTVANAIPDQNATEDSPFSFQFASNTFADVEGNTLTYTAQLSGGGALPSWLTFNAGTRTFSGTPLNANVGTVLIEVIANDGNGGTVTDAFNIVVANTNDAPTVANPISDQSTNEEAFYSFTFPTNTFNDVDGDSLTYTAELVGGSPLPAWLNFNAGTRTFSGVPDDGDVGTLQIRLIANDSHGGTVSDTFNLTIINVNDAPFVNIPIPNQNATEDSAFNYTFPPNTFGDGDVGASFTYTATRADGSALPAWLNFNAGTQTFSGTPTNSDVGTLSIRVTANDGAGATVSDTFDILVANTNDTPVVANPIANQNATENALFNFSFPVNAFNDPDSGDTLSYSAQLAGALPLPGWLTFDAATRTFSGTPSNGDVGTITVRVTATDTSGSFTTNDFDITVQNVGSTNSVIDTSGPTTDTQVLSPGQSIYQSFTNNFGTGTYTIDSIILQLQKSPSAAVQDITVTLRSGAYNGTDIASATMSSNDLATTLIWEAFDFSNIVLNDSTIYYIEVSSDGSDGLIMVGIHNNNAYPDGTLIYASGTPEPNRDLAFQVTSGANTDPILVNPITNQNATEDSPFTFQFASTVFNDPDGDPLTYSATLSNGQPLPSWLSFNAATRTFSGTPTNGDVGTISIKVTADDTNGGVAATDNFDIVIANTNDAPTVANPIPDQNATEDSTFNFTFATSTFADQDGNSLNYSAQIPGGGALPGWLSFDALTRTFSGTPLNANVGIVTIEVVANDLNGGTVTDTFTITVANTNDAPTLANPIPDQNATEDSAFNFQFASNTFADQDVGDSFTYTAQLANGDPLPSWLNFNSATRTFSGTPTNADVGMINIEVIANDSHGSSVNDIFAITIANTNDAPTVVITPANYNATEQILLNLHGTGITVNDVDGDALTITLAAAGASQLTANVGTSGVVVASGNGTGTLVLTGTATQLNNFLAGNNSATLTYLNTSNTPPASVLFTITADDGTTTSSDTANILIAAVNDAPVNIIPGAQSTNEDTALVFSAGNSNQIQISDVDAASGNMEVTLSVTNGTLTLTGTTGLSFTTGDGTADSNLVFSGTITDINNALATLIYNPTADYNGAAVLSIVTSDMGNTGSGGTLTDSDVINITVNPINDAPTVANAIPDQNATEDSLFNFQFALNTFNDIDAGASLSYSAQINGGGALPSWLSFNPVTRTFSGTPTNADVGAITIDVIASDGNGGTITDTFIITVANANDAPTVANAIPDQNATEDSPFTFQFDVNTFADIDAGAVLNYSAQVNGGGALPSWLSFDPLTRTFSGTPTNTYVGTVVIEVIADDGVGGTVAETFTITVANTNDAPTVANTIPDQNATEDSPFNFQFAPNTFNDPDVAASLNYSAQINGGGALPSWLSFNPVTRTFSGTPTNADVGVLTIDVTADDGLGGTVTDTFIITITNVNDAPTVANAIPDQNATENSPFNFQFAPNTFADIDAGTTLTYSAHLAGGAALPSWLSFNAVTRTFSGSPATADVGTLNIEVTANDGSGGAVADVFTLTISGLPDTEYIDTGDGNAFIPVTSGNQIGQSFSYDSASATYTVNEISLYLARYDNAAAQTITVELRDAWSGAVLGSDSIASSQISRDGFGWHSFNFSNVALNDQQSYVIRVSSTGSDGLVLVSRIGGNTFADGALIENGVPDASGWDLAFKVAKDDGNNTAPVLDTPIADRTTNAETPFNFVMPANTFSDPDPNDTITYRAQLAGGGSLGWLTFNEATRTFSGTPHWHQAGTITVEIIATDNHGASTSEFFDITVVNTNVAPTVANPIPDQIVNEDSPLNFQFASNTFADADVGTTFTYSAQLAVLGGLPPWLMFDSATRTFSGTPANGDVGTWTIEVTANDGFGGTIVDTFVITVANTNDAPVIINPIGDQGAIQGVPFNFQFVANTFADIDVGDTLTYSAQLAGGGALPSWLTFNATTRTFSGTPANGDVGTISIDVIADDGNGGTLTDTFDIVVANMNDVPTVANAIPDQNATEDSAFNFQFAANTFADVDVGTTLTYSVQLVGGGALPSWLSFDAATRTFSGTPANGDVGTISIDVIANDGSGGTVTDTFDIVIANTNDAPTVTNAIPNQNVTEDTAFNFQFAANTFADPDVSDTLTYSVQLAGGGSLPSWLTFNAATRTFSGTPANGDVGTISIDVIADDGNGGTVTDTFNIVITNTNDAPTVANAIPNQNATEDTAFNFQFAANTFADVDTGATLTYSAQLAGGGSLPAWLSFDAATRTFSGTPANDDVGTISIDVIANDGNGGAVTDTFNIVVANTNDAPTIANAIPNQNATENSAFSFQFAANTFADVDAGDTLTYTVQLAGGSALPSWLSFNAATRTFSGTPANGDVGTISIDVIANDGNGGIVTDTFDIVIANTNDAPTVANVIPDQNATEETAFSFQFAANTFADADAGATLTYSAQVAGGGMLPSWLNFDAATRTFSGTPANGDVGTISIDVIANDGNGGTVTDTFNIVIANTNDVPTVANPIPNQNAAEDSAFNFQFAANTFADVDAGDALTYTAQIVGGGALPSWLSFDAATRTFSGTPANGDVGTISIDVIADDGNGGTVTDTFTIVIANTNDAPTVDAPMVNPVAVEDSPFTVSFPLSMFNDVDVGDSLDYSAQLANGQPLPAWLHFDANTLTFSGTPLNNDVGNLNIQLITSDGEASVSFQFVIRVEAVNDNPIANTPSTINTLEDAVGDQLDLFATFSDEETPANQLQYSVVSNSNPSLVTGITIDAQTGKLIFSYGANQFGSSDLIIRAQDANGAFVETPLRINVASVNDAPVSTGISDIRVAAGAVPQQIDLHKIFSDIEQGTALKYSLIANTNPAVATNVQWDQTTGVMTITFASVTGGETFITLRAQDDDGLWVETQFKVTVIASTIPEPEVPKPPVTPPVVPPLPEVPTTPPIVTPPTPPDGNGHIPIPDNNGEGIDVPGTDGQVISPLIDPDNSRDDFNLPNDKSSRDYARIEAELAAGNVPVTTLTASSSLVSLITTDAGFAPWEAEDFDNEVRRIRNQMDVAMEEEQDRRAVVAGITFSVTTGILIWSLRASSLLLTLMSMLPLWRGLDPLPILDEVNKRKKELEQQRKDRAREDKSSKEVGYLFDHAQQKQPGQ